MRLNHERSNQYRTTVIDSVNVVSLIDTFAERFTLLFSRLDTRGLSEEVTESEPGKFTVVADNKVAFETVRVVEFAADMRPESMLMAISSMRKAINGLPPDRLEKLKKHKELFADAGMQI